MVGWGTTEPGEDVTADGEDEAAVGDEAAGPRGAMVGCTMVEPDVWKRRPAVTLVEETSGMGEVMVTPEERLVVVPGSRAVGA